MKAIFIFIVIVASSLPILHCSAATLTSNGTGGGNWDDPASWDGANTPADMADGDTLVILASDAITITTNRNFNGVIQIYGTFTMDKGKLSMNSTSVIQLFAGSVIEALNTGQNEKIDIGGSNITSDEINTIEPPTILTEATLPVEVIYFRSIEVSGRIKLEWATSFEENFDFFTIERSLDGFSFHNYAIIYSNSVSSTLTKQYEYTDEMPFPGLSYYRLKATDLDGYVEYHGVVSINLQDIKPDILLYPNPADKGTLTASFNGESESSYSLINITGDIVQEGIIVPGLNYITVPPSLHSSIYFLQVVGNHATIIKKFAVY